METLKDESIVAGKYRIIAHLGQGGMGSVYRVLHLFLNKEYALKTISSTVASDVALQRFQQEAKMASRLDHPSLVQVHDFGLIDDATPYLVMDFVDGITFADLLKRDGPMDLSQIPLMFSQICFALSTAHEVGIVHRDIKPGNIMLRTKVPKSAEGSVKIVDFGIAKLLYREAGEIQALTKTGEIFGSPLYMSPEQCVGGIVDHRSDIYSLGCVLFEMLTGTPPHVGATALNTMMLHDAGKPPTLKEASLGKQFPKALEDVVAKMIARQPENRYQRIESVPQDLTAACTSGATPNSIPLSNTKTVKKSIGTNSEAARTKKFTLSASQLGAMFMLVAILSAVSGAILLRTLETKSSDRSGHSKLPNSQPIDKNKTQEPSNDSAKTTPGNDNTFGDPDSLFSEQLDCYRKAAPIIFHKSESDSPPSKSSIVGTTTIAFPTCSLGFLKSYNRIFPSDTFSQAQGLVSVPANAVLTLEAAEHAADAFLSVPSIVSKIEPSLFKGFVLRLSKNAVYESKSSDGDTKTGSGSQSVSGLDAVLKNLERWEILEAVALHYADLDAQAIKSLNSMKKLRCLELNHCKFDSKELSSQSMLKDLEDVTLKNCGNVDPILASLRHSKNLGLLDLNGSNFNSASLKNLTECKKLESLSISATKLENTALEAIKKTKSLRAVRMQGGNCTHQQIIELLNLPLEHIFVQERLDGVATKKIISERVIYFP